MSFALLLAQAAGAAGGAAEAAADAGITPDAAVAEHSCNPLSFLCQFVPPFFGGASQGWVYMWAIFVALMFGLAIAFERVLFIYGRYSLNGRGFMAQIQKMVLANNIDRAIKLCNAQPHAALSRVLKAGLTRANRSELEIQNAVDEATLEVLPDLQKRTAFLSMIANIATLMGLLGTIYGLIETFKALEGVDPAAKQSALATGISIAMYTTLWGLSTAIPVLIVYSLLQGKTVKIIDEIDQYSVKLINLLASRRRGQLAEEKGAAQG